MDEQRRNDNLEPIYNYVSIQDIALKTSQERWTIETGGERGSGRSVLAARHDDKSSPLPTYGWRSLYLFTVPVPTSTFYIYPKSRLTASIPLNKVYIIVFLIFACQ